MYVIATDPWTIMTIQRKNEMAERKNGIWVACVRQAAQGMKTDQQPQNIQINKSVFESPSRRHFLVLFEDQ